MTASARSFNLIIKKSNQLKYMINGVEMKRAKPWTIAPLALLAACAAPSTSQSVLPDGRQVFTSKAVSNPNDVFDQASATCGGTYAVIDSWSNAGGSLADLMPGPFTWYGMRYVCGAPNNVNPTFPFRGQSYTPPPVVINQTAPASGPTTCNVTSTGASAGLVGTVNCF